jgi:hypothetical protein
MNLPTHKLTQEDQKLQALKKKEESQVAYHLVVKIICWRNGLKSGNANRADKVTPKEWAAYKKHLLTISKTESHDSVMGKLKEIQQLIQKNGGFA